MKRKVKGFTLIELIVVVAIFSLILAAAMGFLPGVMKIMMYTDAQDSGSAGVSEITSYLENELSSVEYLDVYNTIGNPDDAAEAFVEKYYEGVLKKGSTADSPQYGSGMIHVMEIDNVHGGRIKHYDYSVNTFKPNDYTVTQGTVINSAINEANYGRTTYNIQIGSFDSATAEGEMAVDQQTYEKLAQSLSVDNTTFTIDCRMEKGSTENPKVYNFSSTASMAMINIRARMLTSNKPGVITYFGVKENTAGAKVIASITDNNPATGAQERDAGAVDCAYRLFYTTPATAANPGDPDPPVCYTFVYSYSPEINTN